MPEGQTVLHARQAYRPRYVGSSFSVFRQVFETMALISLVDDGVALIEATTLRFLHLVTRC